MNLKSNLAVGVAALILGMTSSAALAAGDAGKGKKVYKRCKACHAIGAKAKNKVGPVLNEVVGRKAGTYEGYKYSKLMLAAGEAGLVWTEEELNKYLTDPTKYLKAYLKEKGKDAKGRGKMVYKLKKDADRANMTAFLASISKKADAN